jgi:hypothetical protein
MAGSCQSFLSKRKEAQPNTLHPNKCVGRSCPGESLSLHNITDTLSVGVTITLPYPRPPFELELRLALRHSEMAGCL